MATALVTPSAGDLVLDRYVLCDSSRARVFSIRARARARSGVPTLVDHSADVFIDAVVQQSDNSAFGIFSRARFGLDYLSAAVTP